jgi:uncharacterized membrane protein YgcG
VRTTAQEAQEGGLSSAEHCASPSLCPAASRLPQCSPSWHNLVRSAVERNCLYQPTKPYDAYLTKVMLRLTRVLHDEVGLLRSVEVHHNHRLGYITGWRTCTLTDSSTHTHTPTCTHLQLLAAGGKPAPISGRLRSRLGLVRSGAGGAKGLSEEEAAWCNDDAVGQPDRDAPLDQDYLAELEAAAAVAPTRPTDAAAAAGLGGAAAGSAADAEENSGGGGSSGGRRAAAGKRTSKAGEDAQPAEKPAAKRSRRK